MSINFSNKPQLFFLYRNIVFFLHLLTLLTLDLENVHMMMTNSVI